MLESLIQEQKDLDLIPKVVTGLLAHRKAGRWLNTQENTFVAARARPATSRRTRRSTPDFVARVWLGNDYAGDHAFKGRTTDYFAIDDPDEGRRGARQAGPDDPEGRQGPALLPHRHDVRAGEPQARRPPTTASSSSARYEARRRSEGRHARHRRHVAHQGGRARAREARRWSTRTGATTSRSSIRCRRASSR